MSSARKVSRKTFEEKNEFLEQRIQKLLGELAKKERQKTHETDWHSKYLDMKKKNKGLQDRVDELEAGSLQLDDAFELREHCSHLREYFIYLIHDAFDRDETVLKLKTLGKMAVYFESELQNKALLDKLPLPLSSFQDLMDIFDKTNRPANKYAHRARPNDDNIDACQRVFRNIINTVYSDDREQREHILEIFQSDKCIEFLKQRKSTKQARFDSVGSRQDTKVSHQDRKRRRMEEVDLSLKGTASEIKSQNAYRYGTPGSSATKKRGKRSNISSGRASLLPSTPRTGESGISTDLDDVKRSLYPSSIPF